MRGQTIIGTTWGIYIETREYFGGRVIETKDDLNGTVGILA
jgi:hypothetical protein